MKDLNYIEPERIKIEVDGKSYSAKYFVKDNLLRVMSYEFGTKTTKIEDEEAEDLAKKILLEQIKDKASDISKEDDSTKN